MNDCFLVPEVIFCMNELINELMNYYVYELMNELMNYYF